MTSFLTATPARVTLRFMKGESKACHPASQAFDSPFMSVFPVSRMMADFFDRKTGYLGDILF
jgi:hypothetical protein